MTQDHRLDLNQWLDNSRETYEGYGYDHNFIGTPDTQINRERNKPSLGSFTELPPNVRDKTKAIFNIRRNKYNCLRLCVRTALYPVTEHATRENILF